tara:strand:- start:30 stop:758 length:729 start_codon:yes stop_codon:yes gene_type:complete
MAFIYEINGQRVEFETEPTPADIDEAARSLGSTPQQQSGAPNMAPQAASAVKQLGAMAPEAMNVARQGVQAVANMPIQQAVRGAVDVGSMMAGHPPYATMFKAATDTATGTPVKEVIGNTMNAVRQGAGALGAGARGLGSALLTGAMAPESAIMMPYQMAAYEQEKIRANPNAPGLESNPYAQVQRGEYATQRQAGAANQRAAVAGQRYGGLTQQEQAILDKDRLNMMMRVQAAKRVLGQQQ